MSVQFHLCAPSVYNIYYGRFFARYSITGIV